MAETPAASGRLRLVVLRLGVFVVAAVLVYIIAARWNAWEGAAGPQRTDDAYLQADLTPLLARVPGYVRRVAFDDYQRVRAGDLLVEIDDSDYRAQLAQADADVAGAEASLMTIAASRALQDANIAAAGAAIKSTGAALQRDQSEAVRQRALRQSGLAGTTQKVEQADASARQDAALLEQNHAQLLAAQRQITVYDAQTRQATAQLAAQHAARNLAALNLGYTRITAPTDGMVSQRQVKIGQYLSAGTQVTTLVALPHVWVIANYKETQLTHLQIGQPARVTIDMFPGVTLRGHVDSYAPASGSQFSLLPPDNATGNFTKVVQRISVKIVIDDAQGLADKLRPGASVIATIDTAAKPADHP